MGLRASDPGEGLVAQTGAGAGRRPEPRRGWPEWGGAGDAGQRGGAAEVAAAAAVAGDAKAGGHDGRCGRARTGRRKVGARAGLRARRRRIL